MLILSHYRAGKTTLQKIQQNIKILNFHIPHNKKIRSNEVDGVDYHFVTNENFKSNC